ncbi:MAG: hypothetical protein HRU15_07215, partial [Planctomycetes bacterium]|nr:hypothetical protein [Planctomycetota bacterium]
MSIRIINLLPVLFLSLLAQIADAATIYTKKNAPDAVAVKDLPLQQSVTQYGITWHFKQPARVAQFINGDYYVVRAV